MSNLGSREMNKTIFAVNEGRENPFPDRKECVTFYNNIKREKEELDRLHPNDPVCFSPVEPDAEEDEYIEHCLDRLLPDNWRQDLKKADRKQTEQNKAR